MEWIGGIEDVELHTNNVKKLKFFKPIHESDNIKYGVSEFHSDEVVEIPKNQIRKRSQWKASAQVGASS